MAVVKDFYHGPCHIRIHDDACVKTKEEVDRILDNLAEIVRRSYQRQALEKENNKEK